ncbi:unnamed protein product [Microthlaspi erraticum]|uniref:Pentacotripeptide-repeat region of PRORP domain-containing protein n=1 Tax=Microthlaspi erraticum TaxID=1685480 RepID=A0A6D2JC96_9BRAS|nr:unnamed protein product [Microthlaspi erraticum]
MIRRWSGKALKFGQPHFPETAAAIEISLTERLRSGLVDIKADDAVELFQSMLRSRPLPSVIDFNNCLVALPKQKVRYRFRSLKQMEFQGIAYDLYSLNIMINCFCRLRKLSSAFSVLGKMLKLGYEPDTVTFSTLMNGLCLEGRVSEALTLVDRMVAMELTPVS